MAGLLPSPSTRGPGSSTPRSPASFLSEDSQSSLLEETRAWNEAEVGEWLHKLGCQQYQKAFETNHINGEALLECNTPELKELGIKNVGDRIRLYIAIKQLRDKCLAPLRESRMSLSSSDAAPTNAFSPAKEIFFPPGRDIRDVVSPESPTDPAFAKRTPTSHFTPTSATTRSTHSASPAGTPSVQSRTVASPTSDTNTVIPIDTVKQNCVRFIGNSGTTRIVNVQGATDAQSILKKAMKKFGFQGHWNDFCVFVTTEIAGQSSAKCITAGELVSICRSPSRPERERLILRKKNTPPSVEEFRRALDIARDQKQDAQNAAINNNVSNRVQKLETFFGEKESHMRSDHQSSPSAESTEFREFSTTQKEHHRTPIKRLRQFFGQRPPSELISSNLAEYFPGHEKQVLAETVRNSTRRSLRMSMASMRRLSTATTHSISPSVQRDIPPPLPNLGEEWSTVLARVRTPGTNRPTSLRTVTLGSDGASVREDEDSVQPFLEAALQSSPIGAPYEPRRASIVPSIATLNAETVSELSSMVIQEDLEEHDEEYEEDYDDHGPTRWIKGALIGSGSFGSVYLGLNALSGELMAVKQVELPRSDAQGEQRKKNMLEALQREIALLRQLHHENIVPYLGSNSDETHLNIFLEYVPGGSVAALLNNYGPFEEPLVRNFVRQILSGLSYLHEQDIIHRDIKGANVLVDNKGGIKISDFGISRKTEAGLLSTVSTHRASLQGSVYWMAPEVVKQTGHSRKADIWSLGCLIVEMFTGQHPFPDISQMQAIFRIGQSTAPDIPASCSPEAQDFLRKTFELDQHMRPPAQTLMKHEFLANWITTDGKQSPAVSGMQVSPATRSGPSSVPHSPSTIPPSGSQEDDHAGEPAKRDQ